MTIRLTDDRRVTLDAGYLYQPGVNGQRSVVCGYAATVHAYQGATTEATFADGSPGYTASSSTVPAAVTARPCGSFPSR